jgi:hypothetical protein
MKMSLLLTVKTLPGFKFNLNPADGMAVKKRKRHKEQGLLAGSMAGIYFSQWVKALPVTYA